MSPRRLGLWPLVIMGILFLFTTGPAPALEVISHIKYYYAAIDSTVTLNCEFAVTSENCQPTEIEWNIVPPNRMEDDKLIIHYTGGTIYNHLYDPLKGRLHFTSPEPQNGDASISIIDLKLKDTGSYQCKVRCLPELGLKTFVLTVMERPSKPVCYMDGQAVAHQDLRLRCRSSQGTPPPTYRWSKTSGNRMLPYSAFVDRIGGDLYLDKITQHDSGSYLCTVETLVGVEDCEVILSFTAPPTMNYGHVTAGVGVAVIVVIITIIAVRCYCRKKNEEEFSNEILQNELPPHNLLPTKHDIIISWPLESSRGSTQKHWDVYEVIDRVLKPGNEENDVMEEKKPHKSMKKDVSEIDVRNPDGERHEKDEELCHSQKEKSEEIGSIEHDATACGEAMFSPSKKKSTGSMEHGVRAGGEGEHKSMKKDVEEIDVCNPDGERHEKDEELCHSQKEKSEEIGSIEHGATACGEAMFSPSKKKSTGSMEHGVRAGGEGEPKKNKD